MKPRNFPGRKLLRQSNAQGVRLTDAQISMARGQRSKKTPRDTWSAERSFRRRGKVA